MTYSLRQFSFATICFVLGLLAARSTTQPSNQLQADEKKPPEAFLSGGARSEKVLVEILTTLRQIDTRVGSIEEQLKKHAETPPESEKSNR